MLAAYMLSSKRFILPLHSYIEGKHCYCVIVYNEIAFRSAHIVGIVHKTMAMVVYVKYWLGQPPRQTFFILTNRNSFRTSQ